MPDMRAFLPLLLLAGCSPAKSIVYYRGHAAERDRRSAECVASGDDSLDCRNAKQAKFEALGIAASDGAATDR